MSIEFTPHTVDVEHYYVAYRSSKVDLITGHLEFDRWLEQVRDEAKAEALREAEEAWNFGPNTDESIGEYLQARAEQYK